MRNTHTKRFHSQSYHSLNHTCSKSTQAISLRSFLILLLCVCVVCIETTSENRIVGVVAVVHTCERSFHHASQGLQHTWSQVTHPKHHSCTQKKERKEKVRKLTKRIPLFPFSVECVCQISHTFTQISWFVSFCFMSFSNIFFIQRHSRNPFWNFFLKVLVIGGWMDEKMRWDEDLGLKKLGFFSWYCKRARSSESEQSDEMEGMCCT